MNLAHTLNHFSSSVLPYFSFSLPGPLLPSFNPIMEFGESCKLPQSVNTHSNMLMRKYSVAAGGEIPTDLQDGGHSQLAHRPDPLP